MVKHNHNCQLDTSLVKSSRAWSPHGQSRSSTVAKQKSRHRRKQSTVRFDLDKLSFARGYYTWKQLINNGMFWRNTVKYDSYVETRKGTDQQLLHRRVNDRTFCPPVHFTHFFFGCVTLYAVLSSAPGQIKYLYVYQCKYRSIPDRRKLGLVLLLPQTRINFRHCECSQAKVSTVVVYRMSNDVLFTWLFCNRRWTVWIDTIQRLRQEINLHQRCALPTWLTVPGEGIEGTLTVPSIPSPGRHRTPNTIYPVKIYSTQRSQLLLSLESNGNPTKSISSAQNKNNVCKASFGVLESLSKYAYIFRPSFMQALRYGSVVIHANSIIIRRSGVRNVRDNNDS